MTKQASIMAEIAAERQYQDAKWGGPRHDDKQETEGSFRSYIEEYSQGVGRGKGLNFRTAMLKTAALAVAAIERHDRLQPGTARTADFTMTRREPVAAPPTPAPTQAQVTLQVDMGEATEKLQADAAKVAETATQTVQNHVKELIQDAGKKASKKQQAKPPEVKTPETTTLPKVEELPAPHVEPAAPTETPKAA
jgi:hypothetical protein